MARMPRFIKKAPFISPSPRTSRYFTFRIVASIAFLCLLLLTGLIGNWAFLTHPTYAVSFSNKPAGLTFQQYLALGHQGRSPGVFQRPQKNPPVPGASHARLADYAHLPSSTEPATMKPINQSLITSFLAGSAGVKELDLVGSDGRLEVKIPPGSLDLSRATLTSGAAATGAMMLQVSQIHGHAIGLFNILSEYQLQIVNGQGQAVTGIQLRVPFTFIYHYQAGELDGLGLDAGHLVMTWPNLILAAQKAHQPITNFIIALTNDPVAQTLTGQSKVTGSGPFDMGGGAPQNQSPAIPHLASMQNNAGQLTYSYPIKMPPGPNGFTPSLSLAYSSSDPNERHSAIAPAGNVGDGWSLTMGSITAEEYPKMGTTPQTTWYFINNVDNVSDRLVPIPKTSLFDTEHLSYFRILKVFVGNMLCFHVWDTSGNYYEFGCTSDSNQYWIDSSNKVHTYRWDLNKIIAPNEGQNTNYKIVTVSYLQDCVPFANPCPSSANAGSTSIRDSAMKQILYGYGPSANGVNNVVGTIDFSYYAPFSSSTGIDTWATIYPRNYNCHTAPPDGQTTNLRCDDPIQRSNSILPPPAVMSTFSLQTITSYVGTDGFSDNIAYGYSFSYQDTPFSQCNDPQSGTPIYCAGEHLLTSVTPTVYQFQYPSLNAHALKPVIFQYSPILTNSYFDSQNGNYTVTTSWQYLTGYLDTTTGVGEHIAYARAYNNTHGTPTLTDSQGNITDDRFDPLYCTNHWNDCSINYNKVYAHPDDHAWSMQVVTQITSWGKDTGNFELQPATISYSYRLAQTGFYNSNTPGNFCYPDQNQTDSYCVGDNWLISGDSDWADYFHAEYHGFNQVYVIHMGNSYTSTNRPDIGGYLVIDSYYSTAGWFTAESNPLNFNAGQLYQEDIYNGMLQTTDLKLTVYTLAGVPANEPVPCRDTSPTTTTYDPCDSMVLTVNTDVHEEGSNVLGTQTNYTYDNYDPTTGLKTGGKLFHNLLTEVDYTTNVTPGSSNATITRSWQYAVNNTPGTNWYYLMTDKVIHYLATDDKGKAWQCEDIKYDENTPNSTNNLPVAGWPTTVKTYSSCANQSATAITNYLGYDAIGNVVATVDGLATANGSLYSSSGCTLTTNPAVMSSSWGKTNYTSCIAYDSYNAQPAFTGNALMNSSNNEQGSINYDYNQGAVPYLKTDFNGQGVSTLYSYDANSATNSRVTVSTAQPGETTGYTMQTTTSSTCSQNNIQPCYETQSNSSLYPHAVASTFYDSEGRAVETSTPIPTPVNGDPSKWYYSVVFTTYEDWNNSIYVSNPFVVAGNPDGLSWIDPNLARDYAGGYPGGTATYFDALGRPIAVRDALFITNQASGQQCSAFLVGNSFTACTNYSIGSPYQVSTVYDEAQTIDPNGHESISYSDEFGRVVYQEQYSGSGYNSSSLTINAQKAIQYNLLDEPTSVIVTDIALQPGESSTPVKTTATYDDLGRMTSLADPDRGTHTYTYDPNGNLLEDDVVSGNGNFTRKLGYNYDLLGRLGCVQDASPTINATGACSNGNILVQNTYDKTMLGTQGQTDYPIGRLTQQIANTYYADGTSAKVTQQMQYDARGRLITTNLQMGLPGSWNVSSGLPTYQMSLNYNDANQLTSTTTSANPSYSPTLMYDPNSGGLIGLNNASQPVASVLSDAQSQINTINLWNSKSLILASEQFTYDGNLRPLSVTDCFQGQCGIQNGTLFSQNRSYDATGNVTSLTTTQVAIQGQGGGTDTSNFCYDEQNRMVWAGNSGTQLAPGNGTCGTAGLQSGISGAAYNKTYTYTHQGQLWQVADNIAGTKSQYLYCGVGHPHGLSGIYAVSSGQTPTCSSRGTAVYVTNYLDVNGSNWGNVQHRTIGANGKTATLTYDNLDHLVSWDTGSTTNGQEWYVYDAAGNRVLLRATSNNTTTMTVYAFGQEEHAYDGTGNSKGDTYYYTIAGRLVGEFSTPATFLFTDLLGSVVSSFNESSVPPIVGNQLYDPYGNSRYSQGTSGTTKGFTGQYNDPLTGLDYYNARYYDPVAGVFLSADTVEGNLQGMNPYAYVSGNPETLTDPTGLYGWRYWSHRSTQNFWDKVGNFFGDVVDAFTGFRSIFHDVGTLFNPRESAVHKVWAGIDLAFNVGMDVLGFASFGVEGGLAREGEAAIREGAGAFREGEAALHDGEGFGHSIEGFCSFTFSTQVMTDHGEKAIGKLQIGEKVEAYNPNTHKMELEPIVHVWIHTDNDLVDLTMTTTIHAPHSTTVTKKSEVVHTNQKHPFFTQEKGFLPVGQIKPGMHILRADGAYGVVTGWKIVPGAQTMYNLEVAQDHTFTVGDGEWVVHNSCTAGDVGGYKDLISRGTKGDSLTPHHMPQGSLSGYYGFDYEKGGAIVMDASTHAMTYTYGGKGIGTMNRIISGGLSFRQALAGSIWDYRRLVPNSNSSIRQLIQYWWDTYPKLMQK